MRAALRRLFNDKETETVERLLTAPEVAELLGVHVNYVYAEAKRGRIPSVSIGRIRRFRRDELGRFLDDNSRQNAA